METDGRLGFKVEHHKDGNGDYIWNYAGKVNDGMVREMMGDRVLRQKPGTKEANDRVACSYAMSCGSYNLLTNNCQHASRKAYNAADGPGCLIL